MKENENTIQLKYDETLEKEMKSEKKQASVESNETLTSAKILVQMSQGK